MRTSLKKGAYFIGLACKILMKNVNDVSVARNLFPYAAQRSMCIL